MRRVVAVFLFLGLWAAVWAMSLPRAPVIEGMVAEGGPAWWFLWFDPEGNGPLDEENALAGQVAKGDAVGSLVRNGYCVVPRLTKQDRLGGTVALTKCVLP